MRDNLQAINNLISGRVSIFKKNVSDIRANVAKRRRTIRSVQALLSSSMAASVLTAIGGLLVARFLGPKEIGSFRAYTIPLTYLMFLHCGTFDGLWRQIPYYMGKEMPEKVDELASAAGAFNLFVSLVVSVGFICCAAYNLVQHNLYGVFGWLSQAIFCWEVFYGGYLTSTYRTLNNFVILAKIQVMQSMLTLGMVFLLPFLRFYGLCARVSFPSLLVVWLFNRQRPLKVPYRVNLKALSALIKIGLPLTFWGTLYSSAWVATESALILSLGGVTALGLFSVAYVMRSAMNSLPISVWQVLTPRVVTNLAQDGSISKANKRIYWVTALLTGFMILLAVAGSFFLDIFVPHVLPKYIAGIPVMKICLWFPVVEAAFLPNNALFATGRPWLFGRSVIAGIIVFPLATYLLLPEIGGALSVVAGSLLGRVARTVAAYVDLVFLTQQEA